MPLIAGPIRDVVFGMAQHTAERAMQIYKLQDLDERERDQAVESMRASGAPTTLPELVDSVASAVIARKLGWFRKNQFFGGLQAFCILIGMPKADARYLTRLIQAKVRQGRPV